MDMAALRRPLSECSQRCGHLPARKDGQKPCKRTNAPCYCNKLRSINTFFMHVQALRQQVSSRLVVASALFKAERAVLATDSLPLTRRTIPALPAPIQVGNGRKLGIFAVGAGRVVAKARMRSAMLSSSPLFRCTASRTSGAACRRHGPVTFSGSCASSGTACTSRLKQLDNSPALAAQSLSEMPIIDARGAARGSSWGDLAIASSGKVQKEGYHCKHAELTQAPHKTRVAGLALIRRKWGASQYARPDTRLVTSIAATSSASILTPGSSHS